MLYKFILISTFIAMLIISSYQDIRKKSVDNYIHYIFISIFIPLSLFIYINYPTLFQNIFYSLLIFLMFSIFYVFRIMAIGDYYIMFYGTVFISLLNIYSSIFFLLVMLLSSILVNNIEGIKLFKENKKRIIIISSLLSYFVALIFFYITFYYLKEINSFSNNILEYYMMALLFTFISYSMFKSIEKEFREKLIFKRKADELVEGDWINNDIIIDNIPENLYKEIEKNFYIKKEGDKYILRMRQYSYIKERIIILLLSIVPLITYLYYQFLSFIIYIIVIILFTVFHNYIFKGYSGLSTRQIELLKELSKYNDNLYFEVQEGSPFLPAILVGAILALII